MDRRIRSALWLLLVGVVTAWIVVLVGWIATPLGIQCTGDGAAAGSPTHRTP